MNKLDRIPFCILPSPLQPAGPLGEALGTDKLWLKRDDLLGLVLGGNKLRKMEFIAAAARAQGAGAMLTVGGYESNLAALLSVTAGMLGMAAGVVFMIPSGPREPNFNSLLEEAVGTEVRWVEYDPEDLASRVGARHRAETELAVLQADMAAKGLESYIVPEGGACLEGSYAFVEAFDELHSQMLALGQERYELWVPVGSGSTYAGLWCGARRAGVPVRIRGISIALPQRRCVAEARKAATRVCEFLGLEAPGKEDLDITDEFVGAGYSEPSETSYEGVRIALESGGLLLDHTYSGKALGGLKEHIARENSGDPIVFWHTGGVAGAVDAFWRNKAAERPAPRKG